MRPVLLLTLAALVLLASACDRVSRPTFIRTSDVPAGGADHLVVRTEIGNVTVMAGPDSTLHVEVRIRARSEEEAATIMPTIDVVGDEAHVVWDGPTPDADDVSFIVMAPPTLALVTHTGSGNIEVRGLTNGVSATTDIGNITTADLHGTLQATSDNGNIDVSGHEGSAMLDSHIGNVTIEGALSGTSSMSTSSGNVTVSVPFASRLSVDARTSSGNTSDAFGIAVMHDGLGSSFVGMIGDGHDGSLLLHSGLGNVQLLRSN